MQKCQLKTKVLKHWPKAGSPVKTRKKMINGKSSASRGSPKKGVGASNRQPVAKDEDEAAEVNGEPHQVKRVIKPFFFS
jgi:hypothetical protein